jgi:single-strand DNA-binding protein
MINQCVVTGNLGEDPKVFYSPEGNPVTSFNLAFQSGKKKTCWIKVVTFHKLAEICSTYLHKGAKIAISGILDQNKWTTDDGQNRSAFQIIGNTIEFIKTDGRGFKDGEAPPESLSEDVSFNHP